MLKKIIDNPCAEVTDISDEVPFTILGNWKGYWMWNDQTISEDILNILMPYIRENHIKVCISTHHDLEGVDTDYMDWITNTALPHFMKNGLFVEILIDSEHFIGNLSLELMYDDIVLQSEEGNKYITPKVDTIEAGKMLALKIVNGQKI